MTLAPGVRLGPYEVTAPLGAGGMGEVFRARDTRLNRDVAIKVLPAAFAQDAERVARFRREAQVLASLNHPHIAAIYGLEESDGTVAIALELVEGEDLAERLKRGAIPVDEALAIAKQIAEGLEAAHEKGIVHRDLKPANVKLTRDGTAKVLDFGLAKAFEGQPVADTSDLAQSPTISRPMTEAGLILGTAAYMSPEQARGKPVDKRSDIWSFGVVFYEMLTGQRLFHGETVSDVLAAVLTREPGWGALPAAAPRASVRLLRRCLERDPRQRLRDIGEARIAIAQPQQEEAGAASGHAPPAPRRLAWTLAAGAIALAAALGAVVWRAKPAAEAPVRRFELPAAMATPNFAIAPDGSRVAYVAEGRLRVRAFDAASLEAQDLGQVPVTTGTLSWSPDGRTIAFTAEGRLRSMPASGGPIFDIAKLPYGRVVDVEWQSDGIILFSAWRDSLYRVPASGGTPEVFVAVDPATEIDFHSISVVPGNRVVVTSHLRKGEASYRVEIIDQARRRTVLIPDAPVIDVQYTPPGYLLLRRFGANEGIWAVPFSERPIDLASAVLVHAGAAVSDAADDGTLLLLARPPAPKSELVWVDRKGAVSPIPGRAFELSGTPSLAPDGRRAALYSVSESASALLVRDLGSGVDTRLDVPEADRQVMAGSQRREAPGWFPSGDRVVHATGVVEATRIMARQADGSGAARDLTAGVFPRVSRDGRYLLYIADDRGRGRFRYAPFLPDGGVAPSQPLFAGADEPNVNWFDLSPDGNVLAYAAAQENGQSNIFLARFPSGSGRWQVTTDGGTRPRFSRDGRELFYLSGTRSNQGQPRGRLNVMPVTLSPTVKLGMAAALFEEGSSRSSGLSFAWFDVARDGRFLMTRAAGGAPAAAQRLVLVQNWIGAMRK